MPSTTACNDSPPRGLHSTVQSLQTSLYHLRIELAVAQVQCESWEGAATQTAALCDILRRKEAVFDRLLAQPSHQTLTIPPLAANESSFTTTAPTHWSVAVPPCDDLYAAAQSLLDSMTPTRIVERLDKGLHPKYTSLSKRCDLLVGYHRRTLAHRRLLESSISSSRDADYVRQLVHTAKASDFSEYHSVIRHAAEDRHSAARLVTRCSQLHAELSALHARRVSLHTAGDRLQVVRRDLHTQLKSIRQDNIALSVLKSEIQQMEEQLFDAVLPPLQGSSTSAQQSHTSLW